MELPLIYPITDTRLSGLSHAEQVGKLIAGGATFIQLREKHASPAEFYAEAAAVIQVARKGRVKIVINDRVDLALALKADGVHLGQEDLLPADARRLLGSDAIIGFSTHTVQQARAAARMPVDYIAFGPIFPTQTKADPDPVVGLGLISEIRAIVHPIPLVAIGGIATWNVAAVISAGADSAAVINALIQGDITRNVREMHNIVINR